MNRDLHIDASLFGLAAGMFFIGYFIFELPSNLILLRVGARRWIMILMIVWGVVSVTTAFVPDSALYIVLRFLLGLAEAGFYPGVILYLTFWLPPSVRSSVMAIFVTAIPFSNLIGGPASARILELDSMLGLRGWQWLFVLEGAPAILLGALVFFVLPDHPEDVRWLSAAEKRTLESDLRGSAPAHATRHHSFLDMFTAHPAVYGWSFAYFCLMLGLYGLGFWIPTVLASQGVTLEYLGWAAALPYLVAMVAMMLWSRRSDAHGERRMHLTVAYLAGAAGFLVAALAHDASFALIGFTIAASGILAAMPVFWSTSTIELAGPLVAAHIAVINSIGNLGGFVGPVAVGWLRQITHHYLAGLACIAVSLGSGAILTAQLIQKRNPMVAQSRDST